MSNKMSKMKFILIPVALVVSLFLLSSKFKKSEVENLNGDVATEQQKTQDQPSGEHDATEEPHATETPSSNNSEEEVKKPAEDHVTKEAEQEAPVSEEVKPATPPATEAEVVTPETKEEAVNTEEKKLNEAPSTEINATPTTMDEKVIDEKKSLNDSSEENKTLDEKSTSSSEVLKFAKLAVNLKDKAADVVEIQDHAATVYAANSYASDASSGSSNTNDFKNYINFEFNLLNEKNEKVSTATYISNKKAKLYLAYFGFSKCPKVCPQKLALIENILTILPKNKEVASMFISLDLEDTPSVLTSFHTHYSNSIDFFSIPNKEELVKVTNNFKVSYSSSNEKDSGGMNHSSLIYIIGQDGKMLGFISSESPKEASDKILNLMDVQAQS